MGALRARFRVAPALVAGLLALAAALPALADGQRVALAAGSWTRDGVAAEPAVTDVGVRLEYDGTGVRWGTRFSTEAGNAHRLLLDWHPGPEGCLIEILLDGERVSPPRDARRPTRRHLRTDLGPVWLDAGEHLVEFVAREEVEAAAVELTALELHPPR